MTAATACRTCGSVPRTGARFCDGCGAPVTEEGTRAEYKQVTVLFADVVHSMDIAAAVGPERLREIMTDLVDRCSAVVKRYGGTVDKFTGDGIMAVFGAPAALEDHAIRASLAALGVQEEEARVETGGPSLTQGRSESSAQPLPDERLRAGRNQAFATLRVDPSRVQGRSSRGIRNASGSGDAPGGHPAPMLQTSGVRPPRQQRSPRSTSA
jgi:class 3 adenylate cyclase